MNWVAFEPHACFMRGAQGLHMHESYKLHTGFTSIAWEMSSMTPMWSGCEWWRAFWLHTCFMHASWRGHKNSICMHYISFTPASPWQAMYRKCANMTPMWSVLKLWRAFWLHTRFMHASCKGHRDFMTRSQVVGFMPLWAVHVMLTWTPPLRNSFTRHSHHSHKEQPHHRSIVRYLWNRT